MRSQARPDLATADGHDRHVPSGKSDFLSVGHEGVYEWAAAHLVNAGSTFLDLGCGTGYGSVPVVAAGAAYDGVDASPAAIEFAQGHYDRPAVRFLLADLAEPPAALVPGSYDVVFSSEVLEHVVDPFALVRLMARLLRDDGACFVGTPNRLWSRDNMPDGALLARSHVMEFTPPAFEALLRTTFDEVTVRYRVFPAEAIAAEVLPADRPSMVRGAVAFAREVMPSALSTYHAVLARRREGRVWSPDDIQWLGADDPALDPGRCVGLTAVCRGPRR